MDTSYSAPLHHKKIFTLELAPATEPPPPPLPPSQVDQFLASLTFPHLDSARNYNASLRQDDEDNDRSESSESLRPGAVVYDRNPNLHQGEETIWSPEVNQGTQVDDRELATAQPVSAVLAADPEAYEAMYQRLVMEIQRRVANFTVAEVVRGSVQEENTEEPTQGESTEEPAHKKNKEDNMQLLTVKDLKYCLACRLFVALALAVGIGLAVGFGQENQLTTINHIPTPSPSRTSTKVPSQSSEPTTQPPTTHLAATPPPSRTSTQFPSETQPPTINAIPTTPPSKTSTHVPSESPEPPTQPPTINDIPTPPPSKTSTHVPSESPETPTQPPTKPPTQPPTKPPTQPPTKPPTQPPTILVTPTASPREIKQLGFDLESEAVEDGFGYSVAMSSDGSRTVVAAPFNGGNDVGSGHVRVFDWTGTEWIQIGTNLVGEVEDVNSEASGDLFGISVTMSSDGSRVAVGAPKNGKNGEWSGSARVFGWKDTDWVQIGKDLFGDFSGDWFGNSVATSSDGGRIAVGAPLLDRIEYGTGYVRVFDWTGTEWVQVGPDLDGEAFGDAFGDSVAISSDGNRIAIGAPSNGGNGVESGNVRVFDWTGTEWVQVGQDLDGEAAGDTFGNTVVMSSDGSHVAVGAPWNDYNGDRSGHIRVFDWTGSEWVQAGQDLTGEAVGDYFGYNIAISSDGRIVAAGASNNDGNGVGSGHARVFEWTGTDWDEIGRDLDGEAAGDGFGYSVAMSSDGGRFAVGATTGNDFDSGYVRVQKIV